jgi:ClpP class serine protease
MALPLHHVASQIFDTPLLIMPEKIEAILRSSIGARLTSPRDSAALQHFLDSRPVDTNISHLLVPTNEHKDVRRYAGEVFTEHRAGYWSDSDSGGSDDKPYCMTASGIAVIPVTGALMKKGSWMSALSGVSSYESISTAFSAALTDPLVSAILFDIDSPGGTTHGCFELADLIYQSRGDLPISACANDLAASAAYAIASSCDRGKLWLTRTAAVGSIGVYALHADQSGADEQAGIAYTYIYAGDKKVDGNPHEPLSRAAKKDIQAEIDRERDMFVACVSRNRSADEDKFLALEAGIRFAEAACPLLADKVGTIDDCIAALSAQLGDGGGRDGRGRRGKGARGNRADLTTSAPTTADVLQSTLGNQAGLAGQGATDMALDLQAALSGATTEELQAALASRKEKEPNEPKAGKTECSACDGTGKVDGKECEACGGSGYSGKKATKAAKPADDDDADDKDDKKGKKGSPEPAADDMKKGKKEAKKDPKDKDKDKDEEDDDDMDDDKKGSREDIMFMCEMANVSLSDTRKYLGKFESGRLSIADLRETLLDKRADAQRKDGLLDSSISVPLNAGNALATIAQGSRQVAAANPGMRKSDATLHFLRTHPELYDSYNNDREMARISGAHRAAYMSSVMPIMKSMGLSAAGAVGVSAEVQIPGSITGGRHN